LTAPAGVLNFPTQFFEGERRRPPLDEVDRDLRECAMTWPMDATVSEEFDLRARRRSDIYDRDPFDDDKEEDLENGEYDEDDDDLEDEDEEDEDEFEDDDDYDDDDDVEEEEDDL
jgi:hypothetical protein